MIPRQPLSWSSSISKAFTPLFDIHHAVQRPKINIAPSKRSLSESHRRRWLWLRTCRLYQWNKSELMLHILFGPPFTSETSQNQMYPLIIKSIFLWSYLFRVGIALIDTHVLKLKEYFVELNPAISEFWIELKQAAAEAAVRHCIEWDIIETSCWDCCETLHWVWHYWDKLLLRLLSAFFVAKFTKYAKIESESLTHFETLLRQAAAAEAAVGKTINTSHRRPWS